LQQVFLNLINNSMDAMPEGGELRVRLKYPDRDGPAEGASGGGGKGSAEGTASGVFVEVSDTGHGIKPEMLPRIFEPMFTTKHMGTGAGLGLAICEQIIRQHGGTIQVDSEPGHGTTFTITLALDCRQKAEAAVTSGRAAAARA